MRAVSDSALSASSIRQRQRNPALAQRAADIVV